MDKLKHTFIDHIKVEPLKGSSLNSVAEEALELSVFRKCNVQFTFNNEDWVVDYGSILDCCYTINDPKKGNEVESRQ